MGVRVGVQDCTGLVWVLGLGYRTDTGVRVGVLRQSIVDILPAA